MSDRKKSLVPFVVAVLFGVVSVVAVNRYINAKTKTAGEKMAGVLVASKTITAGKVIAIDDLTVKEIPVSAISTMDISVPLGSSAQNAKEVESKKRMAAGRVAARSIPEGDPVLWSDLRAPEISRLANELPTNMRAVTIPVDALSGVGYNILPGDHVDILASSRSGGCGGSSSAAIVSSLGSKGAKSAASPPSTYILMQNVLVLAVSQNFNTFTTLENRKMTYSNITLEVTVEEALMLTHARSRAALSCVLRAPGSVGRIKSKKLFSVNCEMLKGGYISELDAKRAAFLEERKRTSAVGGADRKNAAPKKADAKKNAEGGGGGKGKTGGAGSAGGAAKK